MEFSLWVNIQINRFQIELSNICKSINEYNRYRSIFVNYCTECINEYNDRYELESTLKQCIVSKHISLLNNVKYNHYLNNEIKDSI